MTQVQQLNKIFNSILDDFTKQELWSKLDLILLDLKYKGYSFQIEQKNSKGVYRIKKISYQVQKEFVQREIKKSLQLQLYCYLQSLITYKMKLSRWKFKKRIIIYESDYFIEKDYKIIVYNLCNYEPIDIKTIAMIERRFKPTCKNNKKS